MTIQSTVKLTDDQKKAMALVKQGKRHTLLYGGSRSGKTFLIVLCIVLRALKYPGSRHLIYRLHLKDAIQSIWLETLPRVVSCFRGLGKFVVMNETRHVMTFPNGAEIWVAGVDDSRSEDSVLGKEYVTIYPNEASQIPYLTAWKVRTRLAQKIDGCTCREFIDLNPTTRAHWTYKEFVQHIDPVHCKPGDTKPVSNPEDFVFYQLNPAGNLQNIDAEYLKTLESAPESMRKRFFLGEYADDNNLLVFPVPASGTFTDKAFIEWVRTVGPANVRLTAGLDIGMEDADGFVIVAFAASDSGNTEAHRQHWLVYEYKKRREGLSELAKAIQNGLKWAENRSAYLGFSSSNIMIYSDTGGGGKKMVYDLRTVYGLPVVAAYKRDKLAAIELLQDEVKAGQFKMPSDGEFAQECQAIVWTKDIDTGEVVRIIDDSQFHPDIMDAVLYAMRSVWVRTLGI